MRARDLQAYFHSLAGDWPYPADTVDTFKAGDPEAEVRGIAIGWMSYAWALERAAALGCNVFITHEPTFYDHYDRDPKALQLPAAQAKRRSLEANGMVVLRCHDLLDRLPGLGIPDAWGRLLGLGEAVDGDDFTRVYAVPPQTAREVAQHVARRIQHLGQPVVQLIGPAEREVRRLCLGTGAITPVLTWVKDPSLDLCICTDDGIRYWRDGAYAIDSGLPLVVVNHAVSEEAGLRQLAEHLRQQFPDVPVHHLPQTCMYSLVPA